MYTCCSSFHVFNDSQLCSLTSVKVEKTIRKVAEPIWTKHTRRASKLQQQQNCRTIMSSEQLYWTLQSSCESETILTTLSRSFSKANHNFLRVRSFSNKFNYWIKFLCFWHGTPSKNNAKLINTNIPILGCARNGRRKGFLDFITNATSEMWVVKHHPMLYLISFSVSVLRSSCSYCISWFNWKQLSSQFNCQ